MKPDHTRRLIGGVATLLGIWWLWLSVYPFVRGIFTGDREISDFVFLFTMVPMMATPGVLAVVFGVRLFSAMSESSLKWVVGVFVVFGAFMLSSFLSEIFSGTFSGELQMMAFHFMSSLVAIPAYLYVVRFLLHHFTKQNRTITSLLSRWVLVLMAWQLYLLLSSIFHEYSPIKEGSSDIHEAPWEAVGVLVPIIVAYVSYRTFVALLLPKAQQADDADQIPL